MRAAKRWARALPALPLAAALWLLPARAPATVDQGRVCLDCHDDAAAEIALPVEHPPARSADCSSCHNPHAARNQGLLLERPAILCVGCHAEIAEHLGRPVLHQPVAEGRCTDCHRPHGGEHDRLQTAAGGEVCTNCHPTSAKFRADHGGYPVERANCQQCHDPHASQQAGLLQRHEHQPFADGDCTLCHAPAGSTEPFALRASQAELCGDCHEEAVRENRAAVFPHVSAGGSGCSACHNPHGGQDGNLLSRETNELCLSCHDPGGGSSGRAGHFQTHSGLDCDTCHSPHGGDRPVLMADGAVDLCGMCHSHQHAITHPMGEAALDPRNGQAMDCLSCHGVHEAAADKYLYRDGARELCVGCHKDKGVPR